MWKWKFPRFLLQPPFSSSLIISYKIFGCSRSISIYLWDELKPHISSSIMMFVSVCLLQPVVCGSFLPQGLIPRPKSWESCHPSNELQQKAFIQCHTHVFAVLVKLFKPVAHNIKEWEADMKLDQFLQSLLAATASLYVMAYTIWYTIRYTIWNTIRYTIWYTIR